MIVVDSLVKRHGSRTVLDQVSFEAAPGRVTAFLGANGAGKSSTLRILLGLDRADGGTATFDGQEYRTLRNPLQTVGAMLDGSGAHQQRTARHHLSWVADAGGIPKRRIPEVLDQVGLADAGKRRVREFSLGMGQRLGLAAALLAQPGALVLDEPMNGLDPEGIRWLRKLLRRHADTGGTVLLSSHLMGEVEGLADDVVVIAHGRIIASGTVSEVTAGHGNLEDAFFALTDAGTHR